jgi:hypothetical protein
MQNQDAAGERVRLYLHDARQRHKIILELRKVFDVVFLGRNLDPNPALANVRDKSFR